jgi:hypothetical protein
VQLLWVGGRLGGEEQPPPLHQTRFKPSESAVGDEATQGGAAELDGHVLCRDL